MSYSELVNTSIADLQRRFPLLQCARVSDGPLNYVQFPPAAGAAYHFELVWDDRHGLGVCAKPEGETRAVWYHPFEDDEFKGAAASSAKPFMEFIEQLLTNETRIVEKCGLLWHSAEIEIRRQGWEPLCKHSQLALRIGSPQHRVLGSAAVIPAV